MAPERQAAHTDPAVADGDVERRAAVLESFRALLGRLDLDMIEREEAEDHMDESA
jgi:hypothetical protein